MRERLADARRRLLQDGRRAAGPRARGVAGARPGLSPTSRWRRRVRWCPGCAAGGSFPGLQRPARGRRPRGRPPSTNVARCSPTRPPVGSPRCGSSSRPSAAGEIPCSRPRWAALTEPPWSSNTSRPTWRALFALVSGSGYTPLRGLGADAARGCLRRSSGWWKRFTRPSARCPRRSSSHRARSRAPRHPGCSRCPRASSRAARGTTSPRTPRQQTTDPVRSWPTRSSSRATLALRAKKGKAELAQEKALLKTHAKAWLSVFGPALGARP